MYRRLVILFLSTCTLFFSLQATESTVSSVAALQSAINAASPGDIINLANGTYLNNAFSIGISSITVKAKTPGGVYLNGTNAITISGDNVVFSGFQFTSGIISGVVIVVTGSHDTVRHLNFNGYSASKYISLAGQYNTVEWCNFQNKPASAVAGNLVHIAPDATIVGYHKIRYCSFQHMPGAGGDNGNECIRIGNGAQSTYVSRTVVEHNYFEDTGLGDSECISVKSMENTLRFNTMNNNPDAMFTFRNGDNNVAYGNFFIHSGGIRCKQSDNIYIYNNYFELAGTGQTAGLPGSGTRPIFLMTYSGYNRNYNIVHNTFYRCGVSEIQSGMTSTTWANNAFYSDAGTIFTGTTSGQAFAGNFYSGLLGLTIPSGMTNANPQLALNTDGYYGLSATSPCIDVASTYYPAILDIANIDDDPTLAYDIQGQSRPSTVTLKDIGCDEYTTGAVTNRPLRLTDVGPSYLGIPDTIVASAGANGAISPSGVVTVNPGANQTFTIAPSTGYHIDSVIVDGVKVDSSTSFTFVNVIVNHSIRAVFGVNPYTITATAGANGGISPGGVTTVNPGASQAYAISPSTGYHVDSVIVDGARVDSSTSYTFVNVATNHAIRAVFAINQYTITATAGANGSIVPGGAASVNYGGNRAYSISPAGGYHIDSVIVDGVKTDSSTSYTFVNVAANHTIRAVFGINHYTITAMAGTNGTVTPAGAISVNYGASQVFGITPATGYHLDSLIVDGAKVDSSSSYTFTNVTTDHTIRAVFTVNRYLLTSSAGLGGAISPTPGITVNHGANQRFIITPATEYHVDSLVVDGVKVDSVSGYTFINVTTTHTIGVVFKINSYTITPAAGSNGEISPAGSVSIPYGGSQQFIFLPANGYHVDSVLVDGARIDSVDGYTFTGVSANHSIRVTFGINQFMISASSGSHGNINPQGLVWSSFGATRRFAFVPETGYHVDSVLVDGGLVDSVQGYTFTSVSANHSIRVTFRIDQFTIIATSGIHGTISPEGATVLNYGETVRYFFTSSTGYHVDSVIVDGSDVDSMDGYTFTNVAANHSIRVIFGLNEYLITAACTPYGSIFPDGMIWLSYGQSRRFTFAPSSDCFVDSVIIDGIKIDSTEGYTFNNVTASHTLRCVFSRFRSVVQLPVAERWNLVSVPVKMDDYTKAVIFPGAISEAFAYRGAYTVQATLTIGVGYWMKFDGAHVLPISGYTCFTDSIDVTEGWNLIGSISFPVPARNVTSVVPDLHLSPFFGYANGYSTVDTVKPGFGYWVKANTNGRIILKKQ